MLDLTTVCNRLCRECCCGMDWRKAEHYPWEYFERLAPYVQGIYRVDVTGGEPTTHPQFREYVSNLRGLFNCRVLSLETNCFKIMDYPDTLRLFDFIRVGVYPENVAQLHWLRAHHPDVRVNNLANAIEHLGVCVETADPIDENGHVKRSRRGAGGMCNLESREHVLYSEGKLWPCRLGPAIVGMQGVEPCRDWREKISALPIPCENCYFSPDEAQARHGKYVPSA